nr:uncharacterized protein LOC127310292 [Lolium perenne]
MIQQFRWHPRLAVKHCPTSGKSHVREITLPHTTTISSNNRTNIHASTVGRCHRAPPICLPRPSPSAATPSSSPRDRPQSLTSSLRCASLPIGRRIQQNNRRHPVVLRAEHDGEHRHRDQKDPIRPVSVLIAHAAAAFFYSPLPSSSIHDGTASLLPEVEESLADVGAREDMMPSIAQFLNGVLVYCISFPIFSPFRMLEANSVEQLMLPDGRVYLCCTPMFSEMPFSFLFLAVIVVQLGRTTRSQSWKSSMETHHQKGVAMYRYTLRYSPAFLPNFSEVSKSLGENYISAYERVIGKQAARF